MSNNQRGRTQGGKGSASRSRFPLFVLVAVIILIFVLAVLVRSIFGGRSSSNKTDSVDNTASQAQSGSQSGTQTNSHSTGDNSSQSIIQSNSQSTTQSSSQSNGTPGELNRDTYNEFFAALQDSIIYKVREPLSEFTWDEIDEEKFDLLNGLGYWADVPGLDYGQCTGYVSWGMRRIYKIEDYPQGISTELNRNAGEYVSSQRLWLMMHATFVGSATTDTGEIVYKGGSYQPGDIIVFNIRSDGESGDFISTDSYDYWGDNDTVNFVHIGIVGSDTTKWEENLLTGDTWESGSLPEGQYNMHHNIESHDGVCNMLSPEQFITRDVPDEDNNYSRSYEIYRVLAPSDYDGEEDA